MNLNDTVNELCLYNGFEKKDEKKNKITKNPINALTTLIIYFYHASLTFERRDS